MFQHLRFCTVEVENMAGYFQVFVWRTQALSSFHPVSWSCDLLHVLVLSVRDTNGGARCLFTSGAEQVRDGIATGREDGGMLGSGGLKDTS